MVLYFTAQSVALIRTKNVRFHMTMFCRNRVGGDCSCGWIKTAMIRIVRHTAPPGMNPYSFLVIPIGDMSMDVFLPEQFITAKTFWA